MAGLSCLWKRRTENKGISERLKTENKIVLVILLILFAFQYLTICYFNLFEEAGHMGLDSSWVYLRSAMMWNQKDLMSSNWIETSNNFLDTSCLPATLLYGITGDVFLSFGIANILILTGIIACIYSIFRLLELKRTGCLVTVNLILCPYLMNGLYRANDLSYFGNMLGGAAYYSLRILTILLIIREFIRLRKNHRIGFLGIVVFPLCFLAGASSGIYLFLMVLLPYLAFEIESSFIHNTLKNLISKEAIYCYLCTAFIVLGKWAAVHVLHFVSIDSTRTWTPISMIWNNFGAVIQGFLKLTASLPEISTTEQIISIPGLFRVFPLFISFIMIVSIVAAFREVKKDWFEKHGFLLLAINIIVINFVMFGLFNVVYGSLIFEERYLISTFVIIAMITGTFINGLPDKKIISFVLSLALCFSMAGVDVISDKEYLQNSNDLELMQAIKEIADDEGAGIVYCWAGDTDTLIMSKNMRVYDMNHIYKAIEPNDMVFYHWGGDYSFMDRNEDYSGPTLLIYKKQDESYYGNYDSVYEQLCTINGMVIAKCDYNGINLDW